MIGRLTEENLPEAAPDGPATATPARALAAIGAKNSAIGNSAAAGPSHVGWRCWEPFQRCLQHELAPLRVGLLELRADLAASPAKEETRQGIGSTRSQPALASTENGPSTNGTSNGMRAASRIILPNLAAT